MSDNQPRLGSGDVEIVLDGKHLKLRPTLRAGQAISRQHGGIVAAVEKVSRYDFDTTAQVIALGLDAKGNDLKIIPEKVWKTGLTELAAPTIRFLHILANGGRPVDEGGVSEEEDERNPLLESD